MWLNNLAVVREQLVFLRQSQWQAGHRSNGNHVRSSCVSVKGSQETCAVDYELSIKGSWQRNRMLQLTVWEANHMFQSAIFCFWVQEDRAQVHLLCSLIGVELILDYWYKLAVLGLSYFLVSLFGSIQEHRHTVTAYTKVTPQEFQGREAILASLTTWRKNCCQPTMLLPFKPAPLILCMLRAAT